MPFQSQNTHKDQDVFHWTTILLATAMIFIYFSTLICPGVARQHVRNFVSAQEGLNADPTETSVNYKGKCLLRAFEKHFNKIYIEIILTAILSIGTGSHVQ